MRRTCKLSERKNRSQMMTNQNDLELLKCRLKSRKQWSNVFKFLKKKISSVEFYLVNYSAGVRAVKRSLQPNRSYKMYSHVSFLRKRVEDECHQKKRVNQERWHGACSQERGVSGGWQWGINYSRTKQVRGLQKRLFQEKMKLLEWLMNLKVLRYG